jgi:hypothetical protein
MVVQAAGGKVIFLMLSGWLLLGGAVWTLTSFIA